MSKSTKLLNSIILLFKTIDNKRRFQFSGILFINIINGLFEFISVGSALLFLESLIDPSKISSSFTFIINNFKTNNDYELIQLTTIIFILITVATTVIRIINLWLNTKFRISFLNYTTNKLYKTVISQNYNFYLNTNSSKLLTDLTANIEKTNFFFENLLTLTTSLILSISIIISLFKLNINITILAVLVFTIFYSILGIVINKKVNQFSKIELLSNTNLIKTIQESLNAIKDIIISNNQKFFISKFHKNNLNLRRYQGLSGFITTFPRYLFEGLGLLFIGISGFIIYTTFSNSSNIIALLGAFALGAQKLLPAMQSSYKSWSLLYFYNKGLNRVLNLLKLDKNKNINIKDKLFFEKGIQIKNLYFFYSEKNQNIAKNINLFIKKGENIGIFGKTGSGKTTLINILMGLLSPIKGDIFIDNISLFNNKDINVLEKWRNNIAHVPQEVFLYDSTILENIAFCIPKKDIDIDRAIHAAKAANAHEFIIDSKNGYETFVGERGIKLSGGQKQRIGLARALYTNSELLILDESTSALDFKTEKLVIKSIFKKENYFSPTTIIIAHRLSTLRVCDKVIEIKDGVIKEVYSQNQFIEKFQNFF
tara:strand:- start:1712 stop:3502 length:1791 start_codon:yes stop_codon:yes gene_type:complete